MGPTLTTVMICNIECIVLQSWVDWIEATLELGEWEEKQRWYSPNCTGPKCVAYYERLTELREKEDRLRDRYRAEESKLPNNRRKVRDLYANQAGGSS